MSESEDNLWKLYMYAVMRRCNANCIEKGFEGNDFATRIALTHGELSEALQAYRFVEPRVGEHTPEFLEVEEELADAAIRLFDLCAQFGYRLPEAMLAKMTYNEGRPYKHGNKRF